MIATCFDQHAVEQGSTTYVCDPRPRPWQVVTVPYDDRIELAIRKLRPDRTTQVGELLLLAVLWVGSMPERGESDRFGLEVIENDAGDHRVRTCFNRDAQDSHLITVLAWQGKVWASGTWKRRERSRVGPVDAPVSRLRSGSVKFAEDRYEIRSYLGGGSHGQVHEAYDHNQGQTVALKLFGNGTHPGLAFREATVLTALQGDHILKVFNAAVFQDVPYIAAKIASQRSAADAVTEGRGLRPDVAITWTRHMLKGLAVCHRSGLLHRDVKPQNLFVEREDLALLGDFGVVERIGTDGTAPVSGTGRYVAPEGHTTGRITVRSEVYATGATAWVLLTGQIPFPWAADADMPTEVPKGFRQRLRDVAPHVPRTLGLIIERALAVDPQDRFETAAAMDDALGGLRTLDPLWLEVAPSNGADRAWISESRQLEVLVVAIDNNRHEVVTRHVQSTRRVREHSFETTTKALAKDLRRVFDNV